MDEKGRIAMDARKIDSRVWRSEELPRNNLMKNTIQPIMYSINVNYNQIFFSSLSASLSCSVWWFFPLACFCELIFLLFRVPMRSPKVRYIMLWLVHYKNIILFLIEDAHGINGLPCTHCSHPKPMDVRLDNRANVPRLPGKSLSLLAPRSWKYCMILKRLQCSTSIVEQFREHEHNGWWDGEENVENTSWTVQGGR